jgi:hypothetical protein
VGAKLSRNLTVIESITDSAASADVVADAKTKAAARKTRSAKLPQALQRCFFKENFIDCPALAACRSSCRRRFKVQYRNPTQDREPPALLCRRGAFARRHPGRPRDADRALGGAATPKKAGQLARFGIRKVSRLAACHTPGGVGSLCAVSTNCSGPSVASIRGGRTRRGRGGSGSSDVGV